MRKVRMKMVCWKVYGPGLEEDHVILPTCSSTGRLGNVVAGCPGESKMCFGEHKAACEMTGAQVAAGGSAAAAAPMVWWGLEMGGAGQQGSSPDPAGFPGHARRFTLYFVGHGEPLEDFSGGETGQSSRGQDREQ